MENRHKKGFEACGRNLQVMPICNLPVSSLLNCTKISNKQQSQDGWLLADQSLIIECCDRGIQHLFRR